MAKMSKVFYGEGLSMPSLEVPGSHPPQLVNQPWTKDQQRERSLNCCNCKTNPCIGWSMVGACKSALNSLPPNTHYHDICIKAVDIWTNFICHEPGKTTTRMLLFLIASTAAFMWSLMRSPSLLGPFWITQLSLIARRKNMKKLSVMNMLPMIKMLFVTKRKRIMMGNDGGVRLIPY